MGRVGLFMQICERESESHSKAMRKFLAENFVFDTTVRAFKKLS